MSVFKILEEIAGQGSSKNKLALIKKHEDNKTLQRVFRMAYHKRLQYGIKKWPLPGMFSQCHGMLTLDDGLDFLEFQLATRQVTGNAAIGQLADYIADMKFEDSDVLRRVLQRDLSIGASDTSANKVWKNLVPSQPQMLANPHSDKNLKHIKFPAYAQLKADGARCFLEISKDSVIMVSRSGKEYQLLPHIAKTAYRIWESDFSEDYPNGVMIDGELVARSGDIVSSRTLSNGLANKSLSGTISPEEAALMKFEVWDLVDLAEVYGNPTKPLDYDIRFSELAHFVKHHDEFILIKNDIVNNLKEAKIIYNKYVAMKLEGIILKNIKSPWENARSKNLVKFKEVVTIDLEVVDTYEHKKDPNKLGGFVCKTADNLINVNIGSGLTDTTAISIGKDEFGNTIWQDIPLNERDETDREYLWSIRNKLPGIIIECECNGYLFNKDWKPGDTASIFLGVFEKFRRDKNQANTFFEAFGIEFNEAGKNAVS